MRVADQQTLRDALAAGETSGPRSGQPRRTPVGNGLEGGTQRRISRRLNAAARVPAMGTDLLTVRIDLDAEE